MPTTSGVERFIDVKANSKPIDVTDTAVAYGYLWSVCYGVSSATRCFVVTTDAAGLIAANDLEIGSSTAYTYATSVAVDISDGAQFWEILYTDGTDTFIRERSISSWDAAQRTFAQDVVLAAKPVRTEDFDDFSAGQDASWVVPLFYSSQLQSTVLVYNSSGNPISSFARGLASLNTTKPYPDSHRDSANALSFPVAVKQRVDVDDSQADAYTQEGIELFTLTQSGFGVDAVTAEGNLYMGGSLVWQYDGVSLAEAGFLIYPELDKSASGITVSGATLDYAVENQPFTIQRTDGGHTNTYLYYVVYEWYDHQGNRHQSAAVPITMDNMENPGTDNVTIVIPDLNVTWKSDVRAAVYRTHSDSVALAFRVPHNSGSLYPGVSLASGPFTFIDSTADDDLKAGEVLYLSSGELDHVAPVAGTALLSHDDRIFVANKDRVYFSKRSTDNTPPNFNEGLYIQVPPDGGDITGLATLDNKLVMFKRDRMYMSSGEGPNALGIGSYSIPRLIRTDAGCKDKRTIERVAQGVMFQSDKGIYWLNRGEAVNYIGAPVEAYNSDTFVASTLVPDDQIVIFLSESGRTLVYDYEHNLWTTYTDHGGLAATVINDTYYYLRSDGASVYKSYSGYLDAGSVITAEVKFPWIRPSGLQQRWHIRKAVLLGNYLSDHDLQVTVAFNYREYDAYRKSWDTSVALNNSTLGGPATLGGGDALGIGDGTKPDRVYQVGHILRDQRIMAVQLTLTEIPPETDLGASFELTGLAIEAGGYDDTFKLPGSKTI